MRPNHLLIADLPKMLDDIVASILPRDGSIEVSRAGAAGDLLDAARRANARLVVVAAQDPQELGGIDTRLATASGLAVLALARDGSGAWLHTVTSKTEILGDLSPARLLAVVEGLVASRRGD